MANIWSYTQFKIQNIKLEHDTGIKGSRSLRHWITIFTNSEKCNEEMLNRTGEARRATGALNSRSSPVWRDGRRRYGRNDWETQERYVCSQINKYKLPILGINWMKTVSCVAYTNRSSLRAAIRFCKGKAVPLQVWIGPEGSRKVPTFHDNGTGWW